MAMLSAFFTPKCLRLLYDPTTDEEANDSVCVLATAQDPCTVGTKETFPYRNRSTIIVRL